MYADSSGVERAVEQNLFAEYLRKCFFSVDGLWFLKIEEDGDFEKALELDLDVWRVMPKIQARTIRELLQLGTGLAALRQALEFKHSAEAYRFEASPIIKKSFSVEMHECPWVAHIKKSGRMHILERIAQLICPMEHRIFTDEFGAHIVIEHDQTRCVADGCCRFVFREEA